jgi:hypothetical protein
MTPLHFEVWQLALFFAAVGIGLAELADGAAQTELKPRARVALYVLLVFGWWLFVPVSGFLMALGRWLKGSTKQKGKGPWD